MTVAWEFPVEVLVRQRGARFQYAFALAARGVLSPREDNELHASSEGLTVRGRNEDALAWPLQVLKDLYGDRLEVGEPRVRLWNGASVLEPVMQLRISAPRAVLPPIEQELQRRRVPIGERHLARFHAVLRSEAPLARLIGLPERLRTLGNDMAQHWILLSHYAAMEPQPPDGLAA